MEEKRVFSANEEAILIASGMPQERMNAGVLLPSEKRLLAQLAGAQAYMEKRYPDTRFLFQRIDYSTPAGQTVTLIAACEDTPEETFAVKVTGENAPFVVMESHFADIKRAEANEMVREVFAGLGVEAACRLKISGLYGDEYDPKLALAELTEQGLRIPVLGNVYVADDVNADAVGKAARDLGFTGGFTLNIVQGMSPQEAMETPRTEKAHIVRNVYISLPADVQEVW